MNDTMVLNAVTEFGSNGCSLRKVKLGAGQHQQIEVATGFAIVLGEALGERGVGVHWILVALEHQREAADTPSRRAR